MKFSLTAACAAALCLGACGGDPAAPAPIRMDSGGGRQVAGLSPVRDHARISNTRDSVGALHVDGTVFAWGANQYGQLGIGTTSGSTVPVMVSGLSSIKEVRGGAYHMAAIRQDGTVWTWGNNSWGQLGVGGMSSVVSRARLVTGLSNVTALAAGTYHTAALTSGGAVWTWGYFPGKSSSTPVRTAGLAMAVRSVAAGQDFNLALGVDGKLYGWGGNSYGQLGNGTRSSSSAFPGHVYGLDNVTAVSAGASHSLALRADGTVWAWGNNADGQLGVTSGDGTQARPVAGLPTPLDGGASIKAIVAGGRNSAVVYADASVWMWGSNGYGQYGDGSVQSSSVPVRLNALADVAAITIGEGFVSVLKRDGSVFGIGYNRMGQLGNNTMYLPSRTPVQVVGLSGIGYLRLGAGEAAR